MFFSRRGHMLQSVMDMETLLCSSISCIIVPLFSGQKKQNFGCNRFVSPSHLTAFDPLLYKIHPHVRSLRCDPPPPPEKVRAAPTTLNICAS